MSVMRGLTLTEKEQESPILLFALMLNKRKQTLRCSHALLYTDAEVSGSDYASGGAQKLAASKQFSETPRLQGGASRRASSASVSSLPHDDTQYTSE